MPPDDHSPAGSPGVPSSDDPFDLLGLAPTLDLTSDQIQRAYLFRMAAAHPDVGADSDLASSDDSASVLAARLNQARRVLVHPERRAIALYTRLLHAAPDLVPDPKADAALPPGFLMEILSTREEIEGALAARDQAAIDGWRTWANAQRAEYLAKVGALLDACDLRAAKAQLNAWRYIERLIEQLDPAYDPNRADFAG